jgi:hypothetical protein
MSTLTTLALLIIFFFFPTSVFAHGGFLKQAGNIVVDINSSPISPFVGEKVDVYATFKDTSKKIKSSLSDQNLTDWPVEITVIDTFYGDQSKDKVIYKQGAKTNSNGGLDFTYTFPKENYFDIEYTLKDTTGKLQTTGFLIQTRSQNNNWFLLAAFIFGGVVSFFLFRSKKFLLFFL